MDEFFKGLFDLLKGATGANQRRQIAVFISLVVVIVVTGWIYARGTGILPLAQIDRRVELLRELNELEQSGILQSQNLSSIYITLTQELHDYNSDLLPETFIPRPSIANLQVTYLFGGATFWAIMALLTGKNNSLNNKLSFLGFGIFLAVVTNFLYPITKAGWASFLEGIWHQLLILAILFIIWGVWQVLFKQSADVKTKKDVPQTLQTEIITSSSDTTE